MLHTLKIPTIGVILQRFCQNENSVQYQDYDFTLDFQKQNWILYIEDTHQILFRSAKSLESYCVYGENLRSFVRTDRQTDRHAEMQTYR